MYINEKFARKTIGGRNDWDEWRETGKKIGFLRNGRSIVAMQFVADFVSFTPSGHTITWRTHIARPNRNWVEATKLHKIYSCGFGFCVSPPSQMRQKKTVLFSLSLPLFLSSFERTHPNSKPAEMKSRRKPKRTPDTKQKKTHWRELN